jgi:hypothetical protein
LPLEDVKRVARGFGVSLNDVVLAVCAGALRELLSREVTAFKGLIPTDYPGLAAPIWAAGLSRLWGTGRLAERLPALANVAISNVPGPPVTLFLAGAPLRHYYPVSIVTHGLAFNITVQSYAGHLEFGLTACKDVIARPSVVADAMASSLSELIERLP